MLQLILMTLKHAHGTMREMLYSKMLGSLFSWNIIITHVPYGQKGSCGFSPKLYSHQKHFLRNFLTRALVFGRLEEEGASVGLFRVGAGTSYSPSRASITPSKRTSCCRKSCSTLERRERDSTLRGRKERAQFRGWGSVKSSQIYLYSSFFTKRD